MNNVMKKISKMLMKNKTLSKNLLLTIIFRMVSLFVSFFATKAYMSYFKDDVALGIWFTLLSILNWILNFDLGIGNGIRNELAKYYNTDIEKSKKIVTSAYLSLGIICVILFLICELISLFVNWNAILNTDAITANTLRLVISISIFGICTQLWLRIVNSIHYSMQRVIYADICSLVTNICIVLYLYFVKITNVEIKLISLSCWYAFSLILPLFILNIITFKKILPSIKPQKGFFDKKISKNISSLGIKFFIIQISLLLMNSTNQWLISYLCSPDMVVEYQLYFKVFEIAITVFSLFTQPIWSAVTAAYNEERFNWIKNIFLFMICIAVCGIICCFIVALLLQNIFDFWLKEYTVKANMKISFAFIILVGIQMLIYASTCIANGINSLKIQIIFTPICAILKFPLAFLLYKILNDWSAIVLAFSLSQIPLAVAQIISLFFFFKKNIKKSMINGEVL